MTYHPIVSANLYPGALDASGISGYKQLIKPPLTVATEVDLTEDVVDTDGEVLMQAFVSPALGIDEIAAGDWVFRVFGYVDTVDGDSEIVIRVYKRDAAGSETELFDTTTGALTASAAGYTVTESESAFSLSAATDRLVVKFFAKTSSTGTRTVHLFYMGAARQTRLSMPSEITVVPGGDMLASLYDSDQDGQISGGGGVYPTFSGAMLTKSGTQSISASTTTAITFNGEAYDTDGYHSTVSNTSRLTAPSNGYYLVGGAVALENLPDTKMSLVTIYRNGSAIDGYGQSRDFSSMATAYPSTFIATIVYLSAGDYVELMGYQNHSGALNVRQSSYGTAFWIVKVG